MSKENILIIPTLAVGDTAFIRPTVALLRQHFPETQLSVMADSSTKPLIEPHLYDDIWEVGLKQRLQQRFHKPWMIPIKALMLTACISQRRISKVVNLSTRSLLPLDLVPGLEIINSRGTGKNQGVHISNDILNSTQISLQDHSTPMLPRPQFQFKPEELVQLGDLREDLEPDRSTVFLMDTAHHIKDWSFDAWVKLGHLLQRSGSKIYVSYLSNPMAEEEAAESIPNAHRLPKLPTHLAIALLSEFSLAVSLDSGIGHWLSIIGTPTVMLYGPTLTSKYGPLGKNSIAITGRRATECIMSNGWCKKVINPQFARQKGFSNPTKCMASIYPEEVAERILDGVPSMRA